MQTTPLKHGQVDPNLSQLAIDVIAALTLAWARLDSIITQFALHAFDVSLDGGSILIGEMNTKTKLDRLKLLYSHYGMTAEAQNIVSLRKLHEKFVEVRNHVAHSSCMGHYKANPGYLVFSSGKIDRGNKGMTSAELISIRALLGASQFATVAGNALLETIATRRMRRPKLPLAPPSFVIRQHPSPQKSGEGKRRKRPPEPQR